MKEEKIKAIVFDFDGTIADTFAIVVDIALKLNDVLKLVRKDEVNIEDFRNTSSADFIKRLNMPKYKLLYYFWQGKKLFGEKIEKVAIFPGMKDTLKTLKERGLKLAVVTSNSKHTVQKYLFSKNLDCFDIVESPFLIINKSHVLRKVLKKLQVEPSEALYVGDETRDIDTAHRVGVKAVAVTWGYHFRELLVRFDPNYTIDAPEELLELI